MNRFIIPLAVFVVVVGFLAAGLKLNPRELPSPLLNQPAPAFALPELPPSSQTFTTAQMTGEVWLLNVWASWCVACRVEHPLLDDLADAAPVVGLNYKDDADDARAWLQRLGDPYSYLPVDTDGAVGIDYGVYGVPETYLVDRGGVVRFKQVGPLTDDVIRERLRPLIKKLREAAP